MAIKEIIPLSVRRMAANWVYLSCSSIACARKQYRLLFILSHMRSGSTLLTHLLASHPDITGFGEAQLGYSKQQDFRRLIGKVLVKRRRIPGFGTERYVMDKLLHDWHLGPEYVNLLGSNDVSLIFLIREPEGALASLINSLGLSEKEAFGYYVARLAMLERYASELTKDNRCLVLTYEQLLYETHQSLSLTERFLDLSEPLKEQYQVLPTTGIYGVGDFSQNIYTGRIMRSTDKAKRLDLSDGILKDAWTAYNGCRVTLTQCCLHVGSRQEEESVARSKPSS